MAKELTDCKTLILKLEVMNRPFEFNGDFTKGRTSKAAKQAFKDMLEDSVSVVHWEYFNVNECEVHMIIDEKYAFVL